MGISIKKGGVFPANEMLPKLTICSYIMWAEVAEQFVKATPATFVWLVSGEVQMSLRP